MKPYTFLILAVAGLLPLSAATYNYQAILTPGAVVPGEGDDDPADTSTATGTAYLTLTTGGDDGPTLSYEILFNGLAVSETIPRPTLDGPDDLIRGIHLHFGAVGTNGIHALNIYGAPREDDADLTVTSADSKVTGLWDDGDENFGPDGERGSGDSVTLSSALTDLNSGNLYLQAHTMGYRAGELRGQIIAVPEPSVAAMAMLGGLMWRRRRPATMAAS